jgi:Zn-dependent protease
MDIKSTLINFGVLVICLTVHEFSHAYIALKMGDPTAEQHGRLSLNPLVHLDPIGTLMILFVHFGWAKPVPINPNNFKNYKKGIILTSIAGPISNFLMAILGAFLARFIFRFNNEGLKQFILIFVMLNLVLGIFNLLPFPPLDGSRLVTVFIPPKYDHIANFLERYGFYFLIGLLIFVPFLFPGFDLIGRLIKPIIIFLFKLFKVPVIL